MKSIFRLWMLASLLPGSLAAAEDPIPWCADFRTACELAAEQRRLVLLHFYNDHCPPCERLEQHVFPQPQVANAVLQNYIPLKVHAGKEPELATRYQVARWPTDVIVTPSGLEVYRTISPQKPAEYIAMLNQVAQHTGTAAGRQWVSPLNQGQPTHQGQSTPSADGLAYAPKAQGGPQLPAAGEANSPFHRSLAEMEERRSERENAANETDFPGASRRSPFIPPGGASVTPFATESPAPAPLAAATAAASEPHVTTGPRISVTTPPLPAQNPWMANGQPASATSRAPAPYHPTTWRHTVQHPAPVSRPPSTGAPFTPAFSAPQPAVVPADQAPPLGLDGFCPVTLVETVSRNPNDRSAWKKGDPKYGAVFRGRTYLFCSEAQQQKFLRHPEAYAPMFSGYDPVRYAERGELVDGKRAYGLLTPDQRIFLFADEASFSKFSASPDRYIPAASQGLASRDAANIRR